MMTIEDRYEGVLFLKPEDVARIMSWSKAHTYRYLAEVQADKKPFTVVKIANTLRINKQEFFNFLDALSFSAA